MKEEAYRIRITHLNTNVKWRSLVLSPNEASMLINDYEKGAAVTLSTSESSQIVLNSEILKGCSLEVVNCKIK